MNENISCKDKTATKESTFKVLADPSHCCGLKEKNVLNILRDVSRGLKFLHEDMHIIHRDLKPENILLCHRNNETIYKITDLGYAKRMDVSICLSFVGTLQYLAPELYDCESGYSFSADYWSFGSLIFECITGERPFQLTDKAFEWFKCIQKKRDEEIWGSFDESAGTRFHTELPSPNQLSAPVLDAFHVWLQSALRLNAKERGKNANGEIEFFTKAEEILQLKLLHVFDMLSCRDIAYDCQPGHVGSNLKFFLEKELSFPKEDQLLIFATNGSMLEDGQLLLQNDLQKDTIFLFSKSKHARYTFNVDMPLRVHELLMATKDDLLSGTKLKKLYAQSLFYCKLVVLKYKSLLQGLRALMICIKSQNRSLLCLKDELSRTAMKLATIIEVYVRSCQSDMQTLKLNDGAEPLVEEWNQMLEEVQSFQKFTDINFRLKEINIIQEKFCNLQKSPYFGSQQSETDLDRLARQSEELYQNHRGHEKESPNKLHSPRTMLNIVKNCLGARGNLLKVFSDQLISALKSYEEIGSLNSSIETEISNLKLKYNFIMENSDSLSSLQCDSNLLSSLQGEIENDINDLATDVSAENVLDNMHTNFERLRKITTEECGDIEVADEIRKLSLSSSTASIPVCNAASSPSSFLTTTSTLGKLSIGVTTSKYPTNIGTGPETTNVLSSSPLKHSSSSTLKGSTSLDELGSSAPTPSVFAASQSDQQIYPSYRNHSQSFDSFIFESIKTDSVFKTSNHKRERSIPEHEEERQPARQIEFSSHNRSPEHFVLPATSRPSLGFSNMYEPSGHPRMTRTYGLNSYDHFNQSRLPSTRTLPMGNRPYDNDPARMYRDPVRDQSLNDMNSLKQQRFNSNRNPSGYVNVVRPVQHPNTPPNNPTSSYRLPSNARFGEQGPRITTLNLRPLDQQHSTYQRSEIWRQSPPQRDIDQPRAHRSTASMSFDD